MTNVRPPANSPGLFTSPMVLHASPLLVSLFTHAIRPFFTRHLHTHQPHLSMHLSFAPLHTTIHPQQIVHAMLLITTSTGPAQIHVAQKANQSLPLLHNGLSFTSLKRPLQLLQPLLQRPVVSSKHTHVYSREPQSIHQPLQATHQTKPAPPLYIYTINQPINSPAPDGTPGHR